MAAGEVHLTRVRAHLDNEYSWLKKQLLAESPNMSDSDTRTRLLIGFALEKIAGCSREEVLSHITDGPKDRGIDGFFFDRANLKAYIFQSKFVDNPKSSPIDEADAKSLVTGASEVFRLSIYENGNSKIKALRDEISAAINTPSVSLFPVLVSTSDRDIPKGASTILEDGFENSMGDRDALTYKRLSDLYEIISPYGGSAGAKFELVLNGYNTVSVPFNGFYGWVTGNALAELYREQGPRLFAKNLRSGLGETDINDDMFDTALNTPENFWYYNNGVTFIAEGVARTLRGGAAAENVALTISQGSIVNGAQTTSTLLRLVDIEGGPEALARLKCLVRVIEIPSSDHEFSTDVTRFNNSQNGIGVKDFVSLDPFQQELRRSLDRDFAVNYSIRSGEDSADGQVPHIGLQEATIALVMCGSSVENAVRAKEKISTLWRDTSSAPYTQIFDKDQVDALSLYKAVTANRLVENFLRTRIATPTGAVSDEVRDQERAVAIHGNRLFAFYVLNGLNIWRSEQTLQQFSEALCAADLDIPFERLVAEVFANYGASYKAPLFKNRSKCTAIIQALPPVALPSI
ncbi:AIPR family protein [Rhodococcus artemisiae]|uniref:AIPR family protein n=1 Tax=Rhodococcus artemisiae TaxID=714159 RepID=A0ABU7LDE3_9NOCA|nr:AIPR family protein [Rhodococcus artemisiae]MEE2059573.1 AIPR family protein [Rhodococcus artemisiae]